MQGVIIEVTVIGQNSTNNSIDLLFDIENKIGNLSIKKTFLIPIVPIDQRRFIANILTDIKSEEYKTTLSFKCNKSYIDFAKIDKFQLLFILEQGDVMSNIIDIS